MVRTAPTLTVAVADIVCPVVGLGNASQEIVIAELPEESGVALKLVLLLAQLVHISAMQASTGIRSPRPPLVPGATGRECALQASLRHRDVLGHLGAARSQLGKGSRDIDTHAGRRHRSLRLARSNG